MVLNLILLVVLPAAAGFASFLSKRVCFRKNAALAVFAAGLVVSIFSFIAKPAPLSMSLLDGFTLSLGYNVIASFIMIFINFFGLAVCVYAGGLWEDKKEFYSYLLMLIGAANLTVMASDFMLFAFGWGSLLVLLYLILSSGSEKTARKAFSIVGAADFMLILGIALFVKLSGTTQIPSAGAGMDLSSPAAFFAFLLFFAGAAGKAGAWPFHPWIPDASDSSSMPVMAILPASLDKLLGIYLLSRICTDMFSLNSPAMAVMLITGGFTVLFAVLMALVQKDIRKLLSYHAVSQVGYMLIGFGTGTAVGFAAGLFHMLNHAIYKTGLFLSAGSAGREAKTFDIGKMGGLARHMPATFACALVFSLSISGVPPFNGFVSKWMVYQGALAGLFAAEGAAIKTVLAAALIAAMFASALTLASFVKFIHSVFLGQESSSGGAPASESGPLMKFPLIALALLCLLLGVFPGIFLKNAVLPWLPEAGIMAGEWNAPAAFLLLGAGIAGGIGIVFMSLVRAKMKTSRAYYGGQQESDEINFPAGEFYKTVQDMSVPSRFYRLLGFRFMDIYNVLVSGLTGIGVLVYYALDRVIDFLTSGAGAAVLGIGKFMRKSHTGNLDLYIIWCLGAVVVLLFMIAR